MCISIVVEILDSHGEASADVSATDTGVRGRGGAENYRVHAARLLAEPPEQIRPARHRRGVHLDIHAFHSQGSLKF